MSTPKREPVDRYPGLSDYDALQACLREIADLRAALTKLANEADGFVGMASMPAHGHTNIQVMRLRIEQARAALKREPATKEGE